VEFEFDPDKSAANKLKHGIDFIEAQALWRDEAMIEAPARTDDEPRFLVVGRIGDRHWSAICVRRGARMRDKCEYRDWLRGHRDDPPQNLSGYYKDDPFYDLVEQRQLVIVNAVAYRVAEPSAVDKSLAESLPSVRAHRGWLQSELIPDAKRGARFAIFHQWSLWNIDKSRLAGVRNVLFDSPRTKYVSRAAQATIRDWLRRGSLRG